MRKPRPYGTGAYGVGLYERYAAPWMPPAACKTGTWAPFVPGESVYAAGVPMVVAPVREGASI